MLWMKSFYLKNEVESKVANSEIKFLLKGFLFLGNFNLAYYKGCHNLADSMSMSFW
jgi:hypothetical protein